MGPANGSCSPASSFVQNVGAKEQNQSHLDGYGFCSLEPMASTAIIFGGFSNPSKTLPELNFDEVQRILT